MPPEAFVSTVHLDEKDFITICPSNHHKKQQESESENPFPIDFEFICTNSSTDPMITADELFFEGKILPYCQTHNFESRSGISPKINERFQFKEEKGGGEERRMSQFVEDEYPSPRPPKCIDLWRELLKMKKRAHNEKKLKKGSMVMVPICTQGRATSFLRKNERVGKY